MDPDNPRSLAFCARASCASTSPRCRSRPARPGPSGCSRDLDDELERDRRRRAGRDRRRRPARTSRRFLAATASPARPARPTRSPSCTSRRPGAAAARRRSTLDRGARRCREVPRHAPHDLLLRRRRSPTASASPTWCRARCPGSRSRPTTSRCDPAPGDLSRRHRLLRQRRDVLPGDRAAHAPGRSTATSEVDVVAAGRTTPAALRAAVGAAPGRCSTRPLPGAWRATDFALPSAAVEQVAEARGVRRRVARSRAARSARRSPT